MVMTGCGGLEREPPQPHLNSVGADGTADFGSVPAGTSKMVYVFLGNGVIGPDQTETLSAIRIATEGPDLTVDKSCEGSSLRQADVCLISLTWAPAEAYLLTGRLVVTSNARSSPTTLSIRGVSTR